MTYPKWQSAVQRDGGRERVGEKNEMDAAQMNWEECIYTSPSCSPEQGPSFSLLKQCNSPASIRADEVKLRVPGFPSLYNFAFRLVVEH